MKSYQYFCIVILSMVCLFTAAPAHAWLNVQSSYGIAGSVSVHENSSIIQTTNSAGFKDKSISSAIAIGAEYENYFNDDWGFSAGLNYSDRRSFTKLIQGYANLIYHVDSRFYVFGGMNYSVGSNMIMRFTQGANTATVSIDSKPGIGYQLGMGYQVLDELILELAYEHVSLHTHSSITHSSISDFDYHAYRFEQSSIRFGMKYSFFNLFNF